MKSNVKQVKINQEEFSQCCILFPNVKDSDPSNGFIGINNYKLGFLQTFVT